VVPGRGCAGRSVDVVEVGVILGKAGEDGSTVGGAETTGAGATGAAAAGATDTSGAGVGVGVGVGVGATGTGTGTGVTNVGATGVGTDRTGTGCSGRDTFGEADRIGCDDEMIDASDNGAFVAATVVDGVTSSSDDFVLVGFFEAIFLAAAFFVGAFLVTSFVDDDTVAIFFAAAFLTGFGSVGCSPRTRPSRWARLRTRSACCSIIVED